MCPSFVNQKLVLQITLSYQAITHGCRVRTTLARLALASILKLRRNSWVITPTASQARVMDASFWIWCAGLRFGCFPRRAPLPILNPWISRPRQSNSLIRNMSPEPRWRWLRPRVHCATCRVIFSRSNVDCSGVKNCRAEAVERWKFPGTHVLPHHGLMLIDARWTRIGDLVILCSRQARLMRMIMVGMPLPVAQERQFDPPRAGLSVRQQAQTCGSTALRTEPVHLKGHTGRNTHSAIAGHSDLNGRTRNKSRTDIHLHP